MEFPFKTADITRKEYDHLSDGTPIDIYYLVNRKGQRAEVLTYGGIVNRVVVIGGDRKKHNVVLGARDVRAYETSRFISASMHGAGSSGADQTTGEANPVVLPVMDARQEGRHLVMTHTFTDGPYAGITVEIRYALTENNEFIVGRELSLASDAPAIGLPVGDTSSNGSLIAGDVSQTNVLLPTDLPLYFNLAGQEPGNALDHAVAIDADGYVDLERDEKGARTLAAADVHDVKALGTLFHDVEGTSADYREGKALADDILISECLGGKVAGFDYALLLEQAGADGQDSGDIRDFGSVYCGRSRVYMDLATDALVVRLTTFQPSEGDPVEGKGTSPNGNHSGICICPATPRNTMLKPGDTIASTAVYRFSADFPEGYHTDNGCLDRIL